VVLKVGRALLQPFAVGIGGLERETALDTPAEIASVLLQAGRG
jgi:hypothetical protein